jgi:glucokinase
LFLEGEPEPPQAACFGIAGPVIGRQCRTTNLPWLVCAETLSKAFSIPRVTLLNDVQATASAVPHLGDDDVSTLSAGHRDPEGVIGVVAPGTGLGEAFLVRSGSRYLACGSEGGHVSFAPVTLEQLELLTCLERRFGHVSCERVASGTGIANVYDFLADSGRFEEPDWLRRALAEAQDRTPIIVNAALERRARICIDTLDLFVRVLGGVVGNMALKVLATGGVYLGGGIPPRILSRLKQPDFLDAMRFKGRFRDWVARIPVHVILDAEAPLHGAAHHALALAAEPVP